MDYPCEGEPRTGHLVPHRGFVATFMAWSASAFLRAKSLNHSLRQGYAECGGRTGGIANGENPILLQAV